MLRLVGHSSGFAMNQTKRRTTAALILIIFAIGILPSALVPVAQATANVGSWSTKAPFPVGAEALGAATVGTIVYAISGFPTLSAFYAYDSVANTWSTKASLPIPVTQPAGVVSLNGLVYVISGFTKDFVGCSGGAANCMTNATQVYNPSTNGWSTAAPIPTRRDRAGVVAFGTKIYVIGGYQITGTPPTTTSPALNVVEVYDTVTNSWTTLAPMPTAREGLLASVVEGKIYAIGGDTVPGTSATGIVEAYDPTNNAWTTGLAVMPNPRGIIMGGTICGDTILAIGGENAGGVVVNTNEAYQPLTNNWVTHPSMPTARAEGGSATVSNTTYVVGGFTVSPGGGNTNANEAYSVTCTPTFNISTCQNISIPGTYVVTQDMTVNSSSFIPFVSSGKTFYSCFWINSNGIVLDGRGHKVTGLGQLTGPGAFGLDNSAISRPASWNSSVVKNFKIDSFGRGIVTSGFFNLVQNNVVSNTQEALSIATNTHNSSFVGNTVSNNRCSSCAGIGRGVVFYSISTEPNSAFNNVTRNRIVNNTIGVDLSTPIGGQPNHNRIYNNVVANNTVNAKGDSSGLNFWNTTKTRNPNIVGGPFVGGNFWSDYSGADLNSDGLGDTFLPYNSAGNIPLGGDFLPLVTRTRVTFSNVTTLGTTFQPSFTVTTSGNLSIQFSPSFWNVSGSAKVVAQSSTGTTTFNYSIAVHSATFLLKIPVSPYRLSSDIIVGLPAVSVSVTRDVDADNDGSVDIVDFSMLASAFGSRIGTCSYNPLVDFNADGAVSQLDFNILQSYYHAASIEPLIVFDYSLTNSGCINIVEGVSGFNTITVSLVRGTSQPVTLSASGLPAGASATFNVGCTGTPSCSATPPFSTTLTITTSSTTPGGLYNITVTSTGGGVTRATQFILTVIPNGAVGGVVAPMNKLAQLAPFMVLASLIVAVATITVIRVRRPKDRDEKHPK